MGATQIVYTPPVSAAAMKNVIPLTDANEIKEVLLSPKFVQGAFYEAREELMRQTTIVLDGKQHFQRRNILNDIFSEKNIETARRDHLSPAIDRCFEEIERSVSPDATVIPYDLVTFSQRCLFRLAASISGVEGLDDGAIADRFIEEVKTVAAGMTVEWSTRPHRDVLSEALAAQERIGTEFFMPAYARRQAVLKRFRDGQIVENQLPRDVLMKALLNAGKEWEDNIDLMLREVTMFLIAASQTTANSLVSLILRLEDWFKEHPEDRGLIEEDAEFLRQATLESLRLTVAAPARIREATQDVKLSSGREILKGQRVGLFFIPANMDKNIFGADADYFNPKRRTVGTTPWGLSFSAGQHSCPGRPLVTGSRSHKGAYEVDGTLTAITRQLYRAGLQLDRGRPLVPDPSTHYDIFLSVPVRFATVSRRPAND